jgi:hypothetical protein
MPMHLRALPLLWLGFVVFSPLASAQGRDPFAGPNQFPQFRNLSGLSGGGYGLDSQGYPSLSGATAFSTPIAYVLGHDRLWLALAKASFSLAPGFSGGDSNGTGVFSFGHTFGRFNLAFTDLIKSAHGDQAYNLQLGYVPSLDSSWGFSVGVQDWQGNGGAAGLGVPGDQLSARSLFGVVTYRVGLRPRPLYVSAGIGRHRFARLFGSLSYQLSRPLRVWLEEDGYGINTGILITHPLRIGSKPVEIYNTLGLLRGRYFVWSVGWTF